MADRVTDKAYGGMHGIHSALGIQGQGLQINVVGCRNLTDKEWFSRQDPYVIIQYGTNKFRTRTDRDGGKNPMFNEKFTIPLIEGLREVDVQVWNSNNVSLDDYIGAARVLLDRVLSSGYDDTAWQLKSKSGKTAGEVNLILHYSDTVKKPDKHGYGAAYPAAPGGGYPSSGYSPAPTGYSSSHSHAPASGYPQPVPYGSTGYAPAAPSGYPSVAHQSYQSGAPSPYSHSQPSHGAPYPAPGYPPAGYSPAPAPGHGSSYSSSQYPAPYPGSSSGQPPAGYPPGAPPPYGAPPGGGYYDHRPHY